MPTQTNRVAPLLYVGSSNSNRGCIFIKLPENTNLCPLLRKLKNKLSDGRWVFMQNWGETTEQADSAFSSSVPGTREGIYSPPHPQPHSENLRVPAGWQVFKTLQLKALKILKTMCWTQCVTDLQDRVTLSRVSACSVFTDYSHGCWLTLLSIMQHCSQRLKYIAHTHTYHCRCRRSPRCAVGWCNRLWRWWNGSVFLLSVGRHSCSLLADSWCPGTRCGSPWGCWGPESPRCPILYLHGRVQQSKRLLISHWSADLLRWRRNPNPTWCPSLCITA